METVQATVKIAEPLEGAQFRLAKVISAVFSPPLMILGGIVLAASALATVEAWLWAGRYLAVAVLAPVVYIVWMLVRGQVTDFDLRVRAQRIKPYLASLVCAFIAWLWLRIGMAPTLLVLLAGVGVAQVGLMLAVTLWWKISAHTASIAGLATMAVLVLGAMALPLTALVPVVAWARVRLRRHTLAQTAAGAAIGALLMLAGLAGWR